MSWMSGFETSTSLIGLVMFLVYLYLFIIERRKHILIWAISWGMYLVHYLIKILATWGEWPIYISRLGEALTSIWGAFFLILGSCMFLNKKLSNFLVIGWIIISIGVGISIIYHNFYFALPIIFMSITYVWVGSMFFRSSNVEGAGRYLTGSMFILLGLYVSNYPFLMQVEGYIPWGYLVGNIILIMAGFAILLTCFEKTRSDLKRSEQYISMITNSMVDIIVKTSPEGVCEYISSSVEKLLGYKPKEMIGKLFSDFLHPSDIQLAYKAFEQTINEGCPARLDFRYRCKDGSYIWGELTGNRIVDDMGNVIGGAACIRDITERKKREELQKKVEEQKKKIDEAMHLDQLKTEFFANISHELRTPLNIILATIQLFEMYCNKEETKEIFAGKKTKHITIMKQNCYRLLRLINNLIDINKIDADYFETSIQNHNIVNIVEEITLSISDFISNRGIKFEFDTEVEEKIMACDPDNIERIMLNLLSNAVKFTDPGGHIYVNIYDEKAHILICVKDTGIGIAKDKTSKIFERFSQVKGTIERQLGGSGIGLSLVKSLVEMHGGKIHATSEYGKGSEFIVKLPANVLKEKKYAQNQTYLSHDRIERMHIEFSDIYSA